MLLSLKILLQSNFKYAFSLSSILIKISQSSRRLSKNRLADLRPYVMAVQRLLVLVNYLFKPLLDFRAANIIRAQAFSTFVADGININAFRLITITGKKRLERIGTIPLRKQGATAFTL